MLKSSLCDRLRNLIDRGMVAARGNSYVITEAALQYLERFADVTPNGQGRPIVPNYSGWPIRRTERPGNICTDTCWT